MRVQGSESENEEPRFVPDVKPSTIVAQEPDSPVKPSPEKTPDVPFRAESTAAVKEPSPAPTPESKAAAPPAKMGETDGDNDYDETTVSVRDSVRMPTDILIDPVFPPFVSVVFRCSSARLKRLLLRVFYLDTNENAAKHGLTPPDEVDDDP